jgi:hypothetical protein
MHMHICLLCACTCNDATCTYVHTCTCNVTCHMYMCMHMHMHMHMHTCTHAHAHVHVHMCTWTCTCICACACARAHVVSTLVCGNYQSSAENNHHKHGKPGTVPANAAVHRTQKSARARHHGPTNKHSRSTRWKSPKCAAAQPTRRRIMRRMRVALRRPWRGPPSGCRVVRRGRPAASRTMTWRRRAACRCSRCRRWGCPCRRSSPSPSSA